MHELELLAPSSDEAMKKASAQIEVDLENLEIIEEYEPDEIDLQEYATVNSLPAVPSPQEITLYVVRVKFQHYLKEAQEWTQGLIERFAPGATAEAVRFRNIIIVRLNVPEASILIGKMGATLDALQHVVVRALLTIDDKFPDVMLDVEGYREKKLQRLEREATRSADKAVRVGRRMPLPPMSPAERKFVHNLLKDYAGVKTESRGEDAERHIVIEPLNPKPQAPRPPRPAGAGGGGFGGPRGGGGGNRGGNFAGGGNRERGGQGGGFNKGGGGGFNKGGGNRPPGGGGPRPQGGPGAPAGPGGNRGPQAPRISDDQRRMLYGNKAGEDRGYQGFRDGQKLDPNQTRPPANPTGKSPLADDDDSQLRFKDEIDDMLR